MDYEASPPIDEISKRWDESSDQVANTAAAVRTGQLGLANTGEEIDRRRARLRKEGLDLEAIVDGDDSVWLSFFSRGLARAHAVGRVVRSPRGEPATAVGTGVLVSPRLLLTNNHVLPDREEAAGMSVQLEYEFGDDGSELPYETCALDPGAGWFTDPDLDFTVVAVADLHGLPLGRKYGAVKLIEQVGKVLKGEALNVVHHPGGDRKRISMRENRMVAEDDLWLRYTSDTRAGSSGAPVFNDQWEMVALHHGGLPRRDELGNRLTATGRIWSSDQDGAVDYIANEGARVSRIIRRLKAGDVDQTTLPLVEEALAEGAGS